MARVGQTLNVDMRDIVASLSQAEGRALPSGAYQDNDGFTHVPGLKDRPSTAPGGRTDGRAGLSPNLSRARGIAEEILRDLGAALLRDIGLDQDIGRDQKFGLDQTDDRATSG